MTFLFGVFTTSMHRLVLFLSILNQKLFNILKEKKQYAIKLRKNRRSASHIF